MVRPMTILTSPLWPELSRHFHIVHASRGDSAKSRIRIELSPLPQGLYVRAINLTQPCSGCGRPIHPIRSRRAPSKRGKPVTGAYYAAACPLSVNVGCSRGAAASAEYARVRSWFESLEASAVGGAA